jgi:hypothetical protein
MADWNPRLLAVVSWVFPLATVAGGFYALSLAVTDPFSILVAAVFLVVASFVGVATSDSGNRFTTGIAVAAAIPFVFSAAESADATGVDLAAVLAAYCIGLSTIWTIRFARGEDHIDMLPVLVRRVLGYVTYAGVYAAMRVGPFAALTGRWEDLAPFAIALIAWLTSK